jgi:hypothetical protein
MTKITKFFLVGLTLLLLHADRVLAWSDDVLVKVYGAHKTACTATAVAATGDNKAGPFSTGYYMVYAYTSSTDFTGVAMKCIQGGSSITVDSVEGVKFAAGEKQIWEFKSGANYISCQTGSGSAVYDVCIQQ